MRHRNIISYAAFTILFFPLPMARGVRAAALAARARVKVRGGRRARAFATAGDGGGMRIKVRGGRRARAFATAAAGGDGTLYIARECDARTGEWGPYVKVGLVRGDRDADPRLREHQTGNPRDIVEVATVASPSVHALETHVHHAFASQRVRGEWFALGEAEVRDALLPAAQSHAEEQRAAAAAINAHAARKLRASTGIVRAPSAGERALWQSAVASREALLVALANKSRATHALRALHRREDRRSGAPTAGIDGVLRLTTRRSAARLDWAGLSAAHPEVAARCDADAGGARPPRARVAAGSVQLAGARTLRQLSPDLAAELRTQMAELASLGALTADAADAPIRARCDAARALHAAFIDALPLVARAEWAWTVARAELLDALGDDDAIEGCVVWRRVGARDSACVDSGAATPAMRAAALARERPDLADAFTLPASVHVGVNVNFCRPYALLGAPRDEDYSR